LNVDLILEWQRLRTKLQDLVLSDRKDKMFWLPSSKGLFTVNSMYKNLLNYAFIPVFNKVWKINLSLKIKVFLWFLQKGVTLTKSNLKRKNLKGSDKCCYFNCAKTVDHLFFNCGFAKFIWRIIEIATGLQAPFGLVQFFGQWLNAFKPDLKRMICVGAAAVAWSTWLCRNDMVFNNVTIQSPLQVIFRSIF
jgi:hypothetical protein